VVHKVPEFNGETCILFKESLYMHRFSPYASFALALAATACLTAPAFASTATTEFASSVSSYSASTVSNPNGSIGQFATSEGGYAIDPFFPPYPQAASDSYPAVLTTVKSGGSLTLKFPTADRATGAYLGIYSSVGLINVNSTVGGQPQAASSGTITLSTPSEAVVSVSADGTNFVALNQGNPIIFDNPTNAYTTVDDTIVSSGGYTFVSPQPAAPGVTPQLAAATPFMGNVSEFAGKTESQILSLLGGTAGGTWISPSSLSTTGLSTIQFVRFTVPTGDTAFINAVALSGEPPVVAPEPAALGLLLIPAIGLLATKRRSTVRPGR
jgi:hypothetical protein